MSTTTHPDPRAATGSSADRAADAELLKLGYEPSLRRQLGFGSLLVYGLLFFVPMAPVAVFGIVVNRSGGVPLLVYLVAAVVMGLSALSYREMALRYPVAGSVYGYVRLSTSIHLGAAAGWLILLDYLLMPSLLTILSAIALGHLFPAVPVALFTALFVGASLALNLAGMQITTRVGLLLLAVQVVVIALFVVFVLHGVAAGQVHLSLDGLWRSGVSWPAVMSAVSIAALSFLGFDAVSTLNEEARGGGRAVGWATGVLLVAVTALFCLQVLMAQVVTHATSFPRGPGTTRAFYDAVDLVAPAWYRPVFTLTNALVAIFACLVVAHASSARLVFAMARDKVMPAVLARTTRRGVPHLATLAVAALTLVVSVAFAGHAELITSLVTFGALSSYVVLHLAVVLGCFVRERSGRWLVHLVLPVLGAACLVVVLAATSPLARWVALGWLALGMLHHLGSQLLHRRTRP